MDEEINGITEDELVAALFSAQATGIEAEGALTTCVLSKMVNRRREWVRERLRDLIDEGRVESVRVQVTDIAGRVTTAPAYRLKTEEKQHGNSS